jgi:hypothetical protein
MNRRTLFTGSFATAVLGFLGLEAAKATPLKAEWLVSHVPKHEWERPEAEAKLIPVFDVRPEDERFDLAARVFDWVRPITGGRPPGSAVSFPWVRTSGGWVRWASVYDRDSYKSLDMPPLVESTVYMTPEAVKQLWNETLVMVGEPVPTIFGANITPLDDWHSSHAIYARTESGHTIIVPESESRLHYVIEQAPPA